MCETCGCGQPGEYTIKAPAKKTDYQQLVPALDQPQRKVITIEKDILSENNAIAQNNRSFFQSRNIACINLVSSPGSGKTSLLEKTIVELKSSISMFAIEGDQQSSLDADRIMNAGAPVVQINTNSGCHLDARMIQKTLENFKINDNSVLFIENVGNLVCPALFDLGEQERVLIMSVTEGEDKPLKYPAMFQSAHVCLINKIDLLPYLDFDIEKAISNARFINPELEIMLVSVKTGEGMESWYNWCRSISR